MVYPYAYQLRASHTFFRGLVQTSCLSEEMPTAMCVVLRPFRKPSLALHIRTFTSHTRTQMHTHTNTHLHTHTCWHQSMRVDSLSASPAAAPVIESRHIWMGTFTQMDMAVARCRTGVHGHAASAGV